MDILRLIKEDVESVFNIDITRKTRKREYVYARAIFFKLAYEYSGKTLKKIGSYLSRGDDNYNHATVLHACKATFQTVKLYEPEYLDVYNTIDAKLLDYNHRCRSKRNVAEEISFRLVRLPVSSLNKLLSIIEHELKEEESEVLQNQQLSTEQLV